MPPISLVEVRCSVCKFVQVYGVIVSFFLPFLESLSIFSLPSMFACSRTLYIVVGWVLFCNISTISSSIVLSR